MEIQPYFSPTMRVKPFPYSVYPEHYPGSHPSRTGQEAAQKEASQSELSSFFPTELSAWLNQLFSRLEIDLVGLGMGVEQALKVLSGLLGNPVRNLAVLSYLAEADPEGVIKFFWGEKPKGLELDRIVSLWRSTEKSLARLSSQEELSAGLLRGIRILQVALNRMRVKVAWAKSSSEFTTSGLKALLAGRDLVQKALLNPEGDSPGSRVLTRQLNELLNQLTPSAWWAAVDKREAFWEPLLRLLAKGEQEQELSLVLERREKEAGEKAGKVFPARIRFSLNLPRLGEVKGEVTKEEGGVKVGLAAIYNYTRAILEQEAPGLEKALADLGCEQAKVEVISGGEATN